MEYPDFSIKEALVYGWDVFKENIIFFIKVILLFLIFSLLIEYTAELAKSVSIFWYLVFNIVYWCFWIIITMGLIRIAIDLYENKEPKVYDVFSCYPLFFKYTLTSFIYDAIVTIGFLLLIIPGIIWGIKFMFWKFFIIEKDAGVLESLKKSSIITQNVKWKLFLFNLILILINIIGFLTILLIFITLPVTFLAVTYVYKKLSSYHKI